MLAVLAVLKVLKVLKVTMKKLEILSDLKRNVFLIFHPFQPRNHEKWFPLTT